MLCIPFSLRSDKQGSHSGVSEDSVPFECEEVSTGKDRRFEGTKRLPLQYFRGTPRQNITFPMVSTLYAVRSAQCRYPVRSTQPAKYISSSLYIYNAE